MSIVWEATPGKVSVLRPYTGELELLRPEDIAFFRDRYELSLDAIRGSILRSGDGRYALPIFDPSGKTRGTVLRKPWAGAPIKPIGWGPKADTYLAALAPLQSHYRRQPGEDRYTYESRGGCLVVVEDQLSAIKLAAHCYDSVSLLGKPDDSESGYSGVDRVREIARRAKGNTVIVALDSDATDTALLFVKKWRPMFTNIRVAILERDIKDTLAKDFTEVLGV